jgi:hypothetical protein
MSVNLPNDTASKLADVLEKEDIIIGDGEKGNQKKNVSTKHGCIK